MPRRRRHTPTPKRSERPNTADARTAAIEKFREAAATFQPLGLRYETVMALYTSGIVQLTGGDVRAAAVTLALPCRKLAR